ncbi:hypothetical protein JCM10213_008651 [Rhodosporidiobolus nylandii]
MAALLGRVEQLKLTLAGSVEGEKGLSRPAFILLCSLCLVVLVSLTLWASAPADLLSSPYFAFHNRLSDSAPTRVGPRRFYDLSDRRGCNSSELIEAVVRSRIREDGASRHEYQQPDGDNELDMSGFRFSFDVEGCPAPHLFSAEEACDLLSAFGGVFNRGDSRLFLVLTSSFAQVRTQHELCSGDQVFTNARDCKFDSIYDSRKLPAQQLCPSAAVLYDQVWAFESVDGWSLNLDEKVDFATPLLDGYNRFVASLPEKQQQYPTVFVESTGIHYSWRTPLTFSNHILPFLHNTSSSIPPPIPFFSSYPAYNREMRAALRALSNETDARSWMGEWGILEWSNMTDGAWSYDGTHFDAQVAIERAQIFLNVLDAVWGEVVENGGLVE